MVSPPSQPTSHVSRFLAEHRLGVPLYDSPFLEQILAAEGLDEQRASQLRHFRDHGYVVVEDLFEPERIDAIVARYDWLFDPDTRFTPSADIAASPELLGNLKRDPMRRQDAWLVCPAVRELAAHERVLSLLRDLYGREPIPFQTLNFLRGTEQSMHADAVHFSSIPHGFMCGVWVALEDITLQNGPLRVARGSHRYPEVGLHDLGLWADRSGAALGANYEVYEDYVRALLEAQTPEIAPFVVPKGATLIWAANLLHGGSPIIDPTTTRMSQVTHYYFEDCVYYTPIHSDSICGELALRTIRDVRTGEVVPNRLNGSEVRSSPVGTTIELPIQRLLRPDSDPTICQRDDCVRRRSRVVALESADAARRSRLYYRVGKSTRDTFRRLTRRRWS